MITTPRQNPDLPVTRSLEDRGMSSVRAGGEQMALSSMLLRLGGPPAQNCEISETMMQAPTSR